MNYLYIYAAIAIAYQAFKFFRARQVAAAEAEKKAQEAVKQRQIHNVPKQKPTKQPVFFEGFGEESVNPIFKEQKYISYEDKDQKPLVESVEVKAYQVPKPKITNEMAAYEIKKASPTHPILKGLKSKSEIRKAFIYSEIFTRKF